MTEYRLGPKQKTKKINVDKNYCSLGVEYGCTFLDTCLGEGESYSMKVLEIQEGSTLRAINPSSREEVKVTKGLAKKIQTGMKWGAKGNHYVCADKRRENPSILGTCLGRTSE